MTKTDLSDVYLSYARQACKAHQPIASFDDWYRASDYGTDVQPAGDTDTPDRP